MKYKKRMAVAKEKNEAKYGTKKARNNGTNCIVAQASVYKFSCGTLKELRVSESLQMEMYQNGDLREIQEFFKSGGCFFARVQRQITKDNNLEVLALFLRFWEFVPNERSYMINNASVEFVRLYVTTKSLGKNEAELARNCRFSRDFIQSLSGYLSESSKNICRGMRSIHFDD